MRVVITAIALCALSFAAGVAGDLSMASPPGPLRGERVVVQLPPDAVRAYPLPPLATSPAAAAEMPVRRVPARVEAPAQPMVKSRPAAIVAEPKDNPDRAPKPENTAGRAKADP
jgi:hypothetical protein